MHAGRLDVELRGYGSTTRVCSRRVALYWQGRENKGTCRGGLMTVFCQSGVCALRWAGEAEGRPPRSRQFFCHNSQAKFSFLATASLRSLLGVWLTWDGAQS